MLCRPFWPGTNISANKKTQQQKLTLIYIVGIINQITQIEAWGLIHKHIPLTQSDDGGKRIRKEGN